MNAHKITHKQRVREVLAGQAPDRLPVSVWGHDFLREWSAQELAAHTIERQRQFDYDFVKLNPRWTLFAEPWGNQYIPPTEQRFPKLEHKIVHTLADIPRIPIVPRDHVVLAEHVAAMGLVVDELGDSVDVLATLFSPLAVLGLLCGGVGQPLISFAQEEPDIVHQALDHITTTLTEHSEDLLSAGASGLFFAALQWTSLEVCDADFYDTFGRPYDLRVLAAAESAPFNILHVCGNHTDLPRFFDYPTQVFNWDNFGPGNLTLAEAAALTAGTNKVVAGGIPHRKLHKIDAAELAQIAQQAIAGVDGRLLLAGGCGVGAMLDDSIRSAVTNVPDQI